MTRIALLLLIWAGLAISTASAADFSFSVGARDGGWVTSDPYYYSDGYDTYAYPSYDYYGSDYYTYAPSTSYYYDDYGYYEPSLYFRFGGDHDRDYHRWYGDGHRDRDYWRGSTATGYRSGSGFRGGTRVETRSGGARGHRR